MNKFNKSGYIDALNKVVDLRLKRKKIYGDGFKKDPDWAILAEIRQKYLRLELLILNNKHHKYEKIEDTLIDLCNYSLFLLQNKIEKGDKK